jgi:uncharacterized protein YecT (DUF1311 family)
LIDGVGTERDVTRGRACLESQAKSLACEGSSPSLELVELTLMRIDGVGGRPDIRAARSLLADCFDDVARRAVLEHAASKERDANARPVDFCKDVGGTTLTINACIARQNTKVETTAQLRTKTVVAGLDDDGRALFAADERAYAAYVHAMADFVYEVYRDGTIRGAMALGVEERLNAVRARDLAEFPSFVAKKTSAAEADVARSAERVSLSRVRTATPQESSALSKAQQTWAAYRDADIALYDHVFGRRDGVDSVRAARSVVLESRRAQECAPPSASGE